MLSVYARLRPLTEDEKADGEKSLAIAVTNNSIELPAESGKKTRKERSFSGFTKVFSSADDNVAVFESAIRPNLPSVIAGGNFGCFCSGHTGSGKTHTVVGYRGEKGLVWLSAEELLRLRGADTFLVLRFVELYNGQAYDLLSEPPRHQVTLREGEDGNIQFRGATTRDADTGAVLTTKLTEMITNTPDDVAAVLAKGIAQRSVGKSNLHSQSSRSHAVFEVEVVNQELLDRREATRQAEAEMTPWAATRDGAAMQLEAASYGRDPATGRYFPQTPSAAVKGAFDKAQSDLRPWAERVQTRRNEEADFVVTNPHLGGKLTFVDLAGSESSVLSVSKLNQSAKERKEASQINSDLLALRSCIQGLQESRKKQGEGHIPFRNSKLTLALRSLMTARQCGSAMIANICPAANHLLLSSATLQYASVLAQRQINDSPISTPLE